jgi:serine phosphatase RsbU (regulator of sigma subunit)
MQVFARPAIPLKPGEIVLFLTDGVTKSTTPDGHQFGSLRVAGLRAGPQPGFGSNLADGLYQATRTFVQGDPQDDDITSVIIKADRSM